MDRRISRTCGSPSDVGRGLLPWFWKDTREKCQVYPGAGAGTGCSTRKGGAIDFSVESRADGVWTIIDVRGEIDMFTAPKLRERLVQSVEQGNHQIIVDLQAVGFMDSTGLGTLVGGLKRVKEHDGALVLVCSQRPVLRVLNITGLNNVFPIFETLEQAIASK